MLFVTKRLTFSASHRLFNPNFSFEKNEEIYDKCNNLNGHGHNYVIEVTVAGLPNPETGYVIDLKELKQIIDKHVVSKLDHKHLNYDVEFLKGVIPTVENVSILCWKELESHISNGKLNKIKLWETESSFVEYFGEAVDVPKYFN